MSEDIVQKIMDEVNDKQALIRQEKGHVSPKFVAHATHVSQEDFRASVPGVYAGLPDNVEIVPAFSKATQNELSAFKDLLFSLTVEEAKELQGHLPHHPERVFAIATKEDNDGNSIFDEKGVPVPEDGSYAYSLKKCSASINFVDGNIPLLVGFQDKYADFESGQKTGHIYIGKGDSFKAEYDSNGNITEYTSPKNMEVLYHLRTTPQEAMEHNVQFVMFNSVEAYDKWAAKVSDIEKEKGQKFETFISSDGDRISTLQEEIRQGRAVFVNATRGTNPKIKPLSKATVEHKQLSDALLKRNFHQ